MQRVARHAESLDTQRAILMGDVNYEPRQESGINTCGMRAAGRIGLARSCGVANGRRYACFLGEGKLQLHRPGRGLASALLAGLGEAVRCGASAAGAHASGGLVRQRPGGGRAARCVPDVAGGHPILRGVAEDPTMPTSLQTLQSVARPSGEKIAGNPTEGRARHKARCCERRFVPFGIGARVRGQRCLGTRVVRDAQPRTQQPERSVMQGRTR